MKKQLPVIYFIFLSGVASFFNYAIYPVLSRVLGDNEFVRITVALALFTQLSSFMLSIVALTIGLSKEVNPVKSKNVIEKLQAVLTHLFLVLIVFLLVFSPFFLDKLHLPATMLVPVCFMLAMSVTISIISGYLNGKQKLIKLGFAIALSSLLQFAFSVGFGIATKSGVVALNAMALGTFISILIIYRAYRSEDLPRPLSVFSHKTELYRSKEMRSLIWFTVLASLAMLAANILSVIDLLIVNSRQVDAKVYTDIYVVSRIVFFGGMLFVWPFLSKIDVRQSAKNTPLLLKLIGIFAAITLVASIIIFALGEQVTEILLGSRYGSDVDINTLAILAILYKFVFLIVLTLTLYFIAMRSYWAISLPVILLGAIGLFTLTIGQSASSLQLITGLTIVSASCTLFGILGFRNINRAHADS